MAKQEARKSGGGKLSRSETVTVRLDPKLRYLAELAARTQRRTLSSFMEWLLEDGLARIEVHDARSNETTPLSTIHANLWHVEAADRLVRLATRCPQLLNYKEQRIWNFIDESENLWDVDLNDCRFFRTGIMRMLWGAFEQYGDEHIDEEKLDKLIVDVLPQFGLNNSPMTVNSIPRYLDTKGD